MIETIEYCGQDGIELLVRNWGEAPRAPKNAGPETLEILFRHLSKLVHDDRDIVEKLIASSSDDLRHGFGRVPADSPRLLAQQPEKPPKEIAHTIGIFGR